MATVSRHSGKRGIFMKGQLKLSAYMNYGLLTVHVIQGRRLSSAWKQQPNTFVMISLIPEDTDVAPTRCRTAIVTDSSSPSYNEKFSFEVGDDDRHRRLLLTIYHRDHSGHHEALGCTSFGIRHLQQGSREINGWYHLLTDSTGRKKHLRATVKDRPSVPVMQSREPRQIPSVNRDVPDLDRVELTIYRSQYGGFGFTVVDSCPVKIGRVDGSSNAEEAGLQKGDLIVRVNGQNVSRSTSVSVARCIKKSGGRVHLEVHRPGNYATPTSHQKSGSDESGNTSVQDFTICEDTTALLDSAISVDTRRQAALHRLLCQEENFVDLMNAGIQKFSRPLRHCVITNTQHATLFQNIEKIVCMSQYQVRQIIDNLPCHTPSDDDTDTSFVDETDLTAAVGMIYLSKLTVICSAYMMYIKGLSRSASLLATLEKNDQFCGFLLNVPSEGRELSLCDFINRPLQHMQDLCGLLQMISSTTMPHSEERAMFSDILSGSQVFYMIDEEFSSYGKGANSVVSMIHDHFTYSYGECRVELHMDNCSGQNKNNTVIGYGMWRVMNGLHDSIQFNMMEAGHTKFAPDWHFGLWKVRWKRTDAESLEDIAGSVQASSKNGHNIPRIVNEMVPFFDWSKFCKANFKPLLGLKKYHHYRMHKSSPGIVFVREHAMDEEIEISILKKTTKVVDIYPEKLVPAGLDAQRQWYLYNEIAPLCHNSGFACPKPDVSKPKKIKLE